MCEGILFCVTSRHHRRATSPPTTGPYGTPGALFRVLGWAGPILALEKLEPSYRDQAHDVSSKCVRVGFGDPLDLPQAIIGIWDYSRTCIASHVFFVECKDCIAVCKGLCLFCTTGLHTPNTILIVHTCRRNLRLHAIKRDLEISASRWRTPPYRHLGWPTRRYSVSFIHVDTPFRVEFRPKP